MAAAFVMLTFACSFAAKKTTINKVTYFHPPTYKYAFDKLFHGVDVSQWQGSINWKKAKRNGIDFAIIRCGYTSLNRFRFGEDSWFRSNYKRAKKAGVSVGVYYYACATSKKEARKEANYVISILKNSGAKALQLPVVMDYEFGPGRANNHFNRLVKNRGRKYAANVYTENAKAFLNRIRAAGYDSMFYSYRSLIDPEISGAYRFNMDKINGNRQYRFWLAQYSKKNSYAESLEIWQYTSTGKVKGISGNVDRNFWYYPLTGVKTRPGTKSVRKCKVVLSKKNFLYDGTAKIPKITVRYNGKKLVRNRDYTVSFMDNARIGVAYALIHGKGNYSNETSRTFNIKKDPNMVFKPSKIRGVDVDMNVKDREIEMTWAKSVNATRYQVLYKINGDDEWNKKIVQKRRFRLTDLKRKLCEHQSARAERREEADEEHRLLRDAAPLPPQDGQRCQDPQRRPHEGHLEREREQPRRRQIHRDERLRAGQRRPVRDGQRPLHDQRRTPVLL